jgi:hypothetical protein
MLKGILNSLYNARTRKVVKSEFDAEFYLDANPDVKQSGMDPFEHYMSFGWKENRDPNSNFSALTYVNRYSDVRKSGEIPFAHYLKAGRKQGRLAEAEAIGFNATARHRAFHWAQDQTFPLDAEEAKKLLIIVVPEHNEMSGGIYSFFSIARTAYKLRRKHGYRTLVMTRPNRLGVTYIRQRHFRNAEDVYRFEQIVRCKKVDDLYIFLPEYASSNFVSNLSPEVIVYLQGIKNLFINILNQKNDIMPSREDFSELFSLTRNVSVSVAHHGYFGQKFCDQYGIPMFLLPAYTDLSEYDPSGFEEKEPLIIYSPDPSPHRDRLLRHMTTELPEYRLREVRGITFDDYMDLATRARFSLTFGEGFDGYLAQPIYQGGVGFAVFNSEFFPSSDLKTYYNIFKTEEDMLDNIVNRIRNLEANKHLYEETNRKMMNVYTELYSRADYIRRVEQLISRQFELFPIGQHQASGFIRN